MINVKKDSSLQFPSIEIPMTNEPTADNQSEQTRQQTKVDGVLVPIIKINDIVIDGRQVSHMKLRLDETPVLDITIKDEFGILKTLDNPDNDSRLQLQILAPYDDTYKKINLMFYVDRCTLSDYEIRIHGVYDVPHLYDKVLKAYGKISSYDLFETIASDYSLGFASNVNGTEDERYIYNPNMNAIQLMNQEIQFSGLSDDNSEPHVFDWWIDQWNCLNFVDLYTEYKEKVPEKDMQIWSNSRMKASSSDEDYKPEKMLAMFTNNPQFMSNDLYISNYKTLVNLATATDVCFEVYDMLDLSKLTTTIMDGDVHNNIRIKYNYGGELFGDYDYLTKRACRSIFRDKIESQQLEVSVTSPIFSLPRGHKVDLFWYDVNENLTADEQLERNKEIQSNIDLPNSVICQDAKFIINKTISGQYYIMYEEIEYDHGRWNHLFRIGRYADQIEK